MAEQIYVAPRPKSIDGCMKSWSETYMPNTIRSAMDDQEVKVRRRTTGLILNIQSSVVLKDTQYQDLLDWFRINQQGGVVPTRIKRPQDGKEIVVRASAPPQISWVQKDAFEVQFKWEQMPAWSTL
jgi:hypothetical protein